MGGQVGFCVCGAKRRAGGLCKEDVSISVPHPLVTSLRGCPAPPPRSTCKNTRSSTFSTRWRKRRRRRGRRGARTARPPWTNSSDAGLQAGRGPWLSWWTSNTWPLATTDILPLCFCQVCKRSSTLHMTAPARAAAQPRRREHYFRGVIMRVRVGGWGRVGTRIGNQIGSGTAVCKRTSQKNISLRPKKKGRNKTGKHKGKAQGQAQRQDTTIKSNQIRSCLFHIYIFFGGPHIYQGDRARASSTNKRHA